MCRAWLVGVSEKERPLRGVRGAAEARLERRCGLTQLLTREAWLSAFRLNQTHQPRLMYRATRDRRGSAWRESAAAVPAAGGTPVALAAVERTGAQRPSRGGALRASGP